MLAQLEIEYENGERQVVVTDTTWRLTTDGPIIANNEFDGEEYDAEQGARQMVRGRLRRLGLDERPFRRSSRGSAARAAQSNIRVMEEIDPVAISQLNDSTYILDMGTEYGGLAERDAQGRERRAGPSALCRDSEARRAVSIWTI